MKDFKSVDDLSLEECKEYLSTHLDTDPHWKEVADRSLKLLYKMLNKGKLPGGLANPEFQDYLRVLRNRPSAAQNKTVSARTTPAPAQNIPSAPNPIAPATPKRCFALPFDRDFCKRNLFTNIVLYLLLACSVIFTILIIREAISYYNRYSDGGVRDAYSFIKNDLPLYIIFASHWIATFEGIIMIIKWKRSGLTLMVLSFGAILTPAIFGHYKFFLAFSIIYLLEVGILWVILNFTKNGVSTWKICRPQPRWAFNTLRIVLCIWFFALTALPPIVGFSAGFRNDLYSNGMLYIDTYFSELPRDSYELYQKILLGTEFKDDYVVRKSAAEVWLECTKQLCQKDNDTYNSYKKDELSEESLFANTIVFTYNYKGELEARDYLDSMRDKIDMQMVSKYLHKLYFSLDYCDRDTYEAVNRMLEETETNEEPADSI